MNLSSRECENCGASVEIDTVQCVYCGTWFDRSPEADSVQDQPTKLSTLINLPSGIGEFGFSSQWFVISGIGVTLVFYILGWTFEDIQSWLDTNAMIIWVGISPVWLLAVTLLWRTDRKTLFFGLAFAVFIFVVHLATIWMISGSLWDDHVGIAALIGLANFTGWLLGRLTHSIIRWRRVRDRPE